MTSEARRIIDSLAAAGVGCADGRAVAERATQVWSDINAALSPIIGSRGMAALYNRSLYLTREAHPGLAGMSQPAGQPDFSALHDRLAHQAPPDAVAAVCSLVQTFCDLLAHLIGTSLTERLLSTVSDPPSRGTAAEDASP